MQSATVQSAIKIRQTEDLELIRQLDARCFPGEVVKEPALEETTWWLVQIGEEPVGYAGCKLVKPDTAQFSRIGVLPIARGLRLYSRLLRIARVWAKRQGATEMRTYCSVQNVPSIRGLTSDGFKPHRCEVAVRGTFLHFKRSLVAEGRAH